MCYINDTDTWQLIVEDNFSHAEETVRVRKCAELCRLGLWCTGALLAESCGVLLCVCMCVCVCVGAGVSVFGVMFSIMYAMCNVMCITKCALVLDVVVHRIGCQPMTIHAKNQ